MKRSDGCNQTAGPAALIHQALNHLATLRTHAQLGELKHSYGPAELTEHFQSIVQEADEVAGLLQTLQRSLH